jgi:hypothetical protein
LILVGVAKSARIKSASFLQKDELTVERGIVLAILGAGGHENESEGQKETHRIRRNINDLNSSDFQD